MIFRNGAGACLNGLAARISRWPSAGCRAPALAGVRAQRIADDEQCLVVPHLRQRRRTTKQLGLVDESVEGAAGVYLVAYRLAPAHALGEATFDDDPLPLGEPGGG